MGFDSIYTHIRKNIKSVCIDSKLKWCLKAMLLSCITQGVNANDSILLFHKKVNIGLAIASLFAFYIEEPERYPIRTESIQCPALEPLNMKIYQDYCLQTT